MNVARDLTALLQQEGHEVDLFYFDEKDGAVADSRAQQINFRQKRKWSNYDLVHSHGLRPDMYVWLHRKKMPATVSTLHNYVKEDLTYYYGKAVAGIFTPLWNLACSRHSANVVLSQDMKSYYSGFWRNPGIQVIPNTRLIDTSPNPEREAEIRSWARGRKVLGSISSLSPRKGVEQVLGFLRSSPGWVYVHLGGGDPEPLLKMIAEQGLEEQVILAGFRERPWQYARAFDVFILPSRSEGFPLSLIEAIQVGIPVATSDIPVFREIFSEQEICRFRLDDQEDMSAAIHRAMKERSSLVANSQKKFEKCYSPRAVVQQYLNLYKELK